MDDMVAVRLPESVLGQIAASLQEAGGLAAMFSRAALSNPVAFVPEETDADALEDLATGGIMSQPEADAELSLFLHFLKKRNGRLHSVVFDDPWSQVADLDYSGSPPDEMAVVGGRINYAYDLSQLTQERVWQYRANAVSFLKIIYVSELTVDRIHELAEEGGALDVLARPVRHVVVNAYDDETWVIVNAQYPD